MERSSRGGEWDAGGGYASDAEAKTRGEKIEG